jgi:poly(3-hydroxybutyrate) depolymerase
MKHFGLLFLIVLAFHLTSKAQLQTITVDGTQRTYLVYAPNNLGEQRPLLISCHGANQDANYMKNTQMVMDAVADSAKFLIVFPNGIDKQWDISGDRDIHLITALIEKMVTQYNIDRNRVYLSGFSMGGMLTYHAMNKIADKIAAFAPISGYPLWGSSAESSRPVPILHTQGLADEVCQPDGVRGVLQKWVQRNHCNATPVVTKRYRGFSHATMSVWAGGDEGTEVRLLELEGKGHWVSNDGLITGDEIWRFCKRYSLQMNEPQVRITAPQDGLTFITFGGSSQTGAITVSATASDPDGSIVKVDFYDGKTLLGTATQSPYTFTVSELTAGKHALRAVATDNEGLTGEAQVTVNVEEPVGTYVLTKTFATEGSVPDGWTTYDGSDLRVGYSDGYSQGCRVFHFTGEQHDFEWGLYARNTNGNARAGYARFADKQTSTTLTLYPGNYELVHRLANWNRADFSPVCIAVETISGETVAEDVVTPTANVGNASSNSFSGATLGRFSFYILQQGRYLITFYTADEPWADVVVGQAALRRKGEVTGIKSFSCPSVRDSHSTDSWHSLDGRRLQGRPDMPGVYVNQGRKVVVK